ncbi:MAG TPA: hypothetical protein VM260_03560 [Pirellula sp.]|nr:hypothetical protein [Pirellula sp.]
MKRKRQITKTLISKLLRESAFDPRVRGPFKIIIEEHGDDPRTLENRAIEMIREAQIGRDDPSYHDKISKAIALLVIARASTEIKQ